MADIINAVMELGGNELAEDLERYLITRRSTKVIWGCFFIVFILKIDKFYKSVFNNKLIQKIFFAFIFFFC